MTTLTAEEYQQLISKPKRNKFNARRTEVDGRMFASEKEAKRYADLKNLFRAGKIAGLRVQPVYPLHSVDGFEVGKYVADFEYRCHERGCLVVEDVKSKATKTPLYRWKKRHFEAEYRTRITEVI